MPGKENHTPATTRESTFPLFAAGGTVTLLTAEAAAGLLSPPPTFGGCDDHGPFFYLAPTTGDDSGHSN